MKPLTELKDGQRVLVEFTVNIVDGYYEFKPVNSLDFVLPISFNNKLNTYDFDEVMQGAKEIYFHDFKMKVNEINDKTFSSQERTEKLYDLFKSYSPKSEVIMPEAGEVYEFSNDGKNWYNFILTGFDVVDNNNAFNHIRLSEQPSEEEKKAIELLKSKGYKIEKE